MFGILLVFQLFLEVFTGLATPEANCRLQDVVLMYVRVFVKRNICTSEMGIKLSLQLDRQSFVINGLLLHMSVEIE